MLDHISTMEILLGGLYCLIVWLLFEAGVATQRYYTEQYGPEDDVKGAHLSILMHGIFILPAVYHLCKFWWHELDLFGGGS